MTTSTCRVEGCIQEQVEHSDHTWSDGVQVKTVWTRGRCHTEGVVTAYALTDDDREAFPDDEILITIGTGLDPDAEAKLSIEQAEQLYAAIQTAIEFTHRRASTEASR